MTDHELILQLKDNCHRAFRIIYHRYHKQVASFSTLYISKEDIEDVVQEVFIKLWINRSKLEANKNIKGYLFITTRNHIFDKFRKKSSDYYRISLLDTLEKVSEENIEEQVYTQDLAEFINELINELPPRCKQVFIMSRQQMLTNKDIAEELGINIKTVEATITRTLKILRESLLIFMFIYHN